MTSSLQIAPDDEVPLRGARRLALEAYGSNEESDIKRLYNEAPFLPVFRLKPKGPPWGTRRSCVSITRPWRRRRRRRRDESRGRGGRRARHSKGRGRQAKAAPTRAQSTLPESQQNNGDWLRPPPRPGADQFLCGGNRDRRSRTFSEE